MASSGTGAKGFGGRNRLKSLADTGGSAPAPNPAPEYSGQAEGGRGGPQTHAGHHGAKTIVGIANLPTQDSLQNAGKGAGQGVDIGHKVPTQREMVGNSDVGSGAESQGPDGNFGGNPGQNQSIPSISYP